MSRIQCTVLKSNLVITNRPKFVCYNRVALCCKMLIWELVLAEFHCIRQNQNKFENQKNNDQNCFSDFWVTSVLGTLNSKCRWFAKVRLKNPYRQGPQTRVSRDKCRPPIRLCHHFFFTFLWNSKIMLKGRIQSEM